MVKAQIGKKEPFVPKPDLTFREYVAIKNYFNGADFERNSFLALSMPLTASILWFSNKLLKRFKWL